jgi:prepilin-type N-terminal cleavage/methylation domain-containing protein
MSNKSKQKAFTLLELLVVMAIMALLVGLGLRTFGTVQQKSRDGRRKQELQSISKSLELYYNDFKHYPLSFGGKIMGCGAGAAEECAWGGVWQNSSNQTMYMSILPQDPGGNQYFYLADVEGNSYSLFTYLENLEDSQVVLGSGGEPGYYSSTNCRIIGGALTPNTCNYLIKSTNLTTTPAVVDSY